MNEEESVILHQLEEKTIVFICRNCGEHFTMTLLKMYRICSKEIIAPNLCKGCGSYRKALKSLARRQERQTRAQQSTASSGEG